MAQDSCEKVTELIQFFRGHIKESKVYYTTKSRLWFKYIPAGCGQPSKERQSDEGITFVNYI